MKMVQTTETDIPPIIAVAKGAYASLPTPSFIAIGSRPMIVASDVIKIGRNRTLPDIATASSSAIPYFCCVGVLSTIWMLFDTTIPKIIKFHISDCTFRVVPLR